MRIATAQLREALKSKLERSGYTATEASHIIFLLLEEESQPMALGVNFTPTYFRDADGSLHNGADMRVEPAGPEEKWRSVDRWQVTFERDSDA